MAKAKTGARPSDIGFWGIIALFSAGIAVLSGGVAALVPDDLTARMRDSRVAGASFSQVRASVAEMGSDIARLERGASELERQVALGRGQGGEALRRIAALEATVPRILETIAEQRAEIDRSAVTASITPPADQAAEEDTEETDVEDLDGENDHVRVTHSPFPLPAAAAATLQPLPPPLAGSEPAIEAPPVFAAPVSVALGPPLETADEAVAVWSDYETRLGPLLAGLEPTVSAEPRSPQLIAGPLPDLASAENFCARLERIAITCVPGVNAGHPLAIDRLTR